MIRSVVLFTGLIIGLAANSLAEDTAVGQVKNFTGAAYVLQGNTQTSARQGLDIHRRDVLVTGPDGALGIILKDNTVLSLGPNSRLSIEKFEFVPRERKFSLLTRMIKGTASYISGTIGKLAPETVKFETPDATLGIRGTRFLVKVDPR